jgi:TRAP transporter TAXI family solute receptor
MARLYPEPLQWFARKDSDIESLKDFKGKKVSIGRPASYMQLLGKQVLAAAGLPETDWKQSYTGFVTASEQFQNKQIDGCFFYTGIPNATLTQIAVSVPIRMLPIDDETYAKIKKEIPFASRMEIPQGAYPGIDEPVKSCSIWALMLARNDIPEDMVYKLTEALFANAEELAKVNAQAKWIELKYNKDFSIPVHPGAAKYFETKGIQ